MFLSVVILGRFTTETHAMALYISTDTPPLFTPRPGTFPVLDFAIANRDTIKLSTSIDRVLDNTYSAAELRYLKAHGYQVVDGYTLVPPKIGG